MTGDDLVKQAEILQAAERDAGWAPTRTLQMEELRAALEKLPKPDGDVEELCLVGS